MITNKPLPKWLNDYIFGFLGAEEKPDPKEFCKNLDSDDEKNKIYLGTYFPRSFAESFCIHSNLFSYEPYRTHLEKKEELSLLSIGCGTGGDILGMICAIALALIRPSAIANVCFFMLRKLLYDYSYFMPIFYSFAKVNIFFRLSLAL